MQPHRKQDAELDELRRKYEDLCTQLTEKSGRDPDTEGVIIEKLQKLSDRIVALAQETGMSRPSGRDEGAVGEPDEGPADEIPADASPAGAARTEGSLERLLALLERQNRDVEHILRRSDEHRDQLERVERRLIEAMPVIERQLPELRAATEHQRQRITALAVAVQRLFQWLATRRGNRP